MPCEEFCHFLIWCCYIGFFCKQKADGALWRFFCSLHVDFLSTTLSYLPPTLPNDQLPSCSSPASIIPNIEAPLIKTLSIIGPTPLLSRFPALKRCASSGQSHIYANAVHGDLCVDVVMCRR